LAVLIASLIGKAAAVLCQKPDESVHALKVRAVVKVASLTAAHHKIGARELLQVKGKRRRWNLKPFREIRWDESLRATLDQESKDGEAGLRCERAQSVDGIF
jgi:hypothetical protein